MLSHVQHVATTAATLVASPCVLAAAVLALAEEPLFAFINVFATVYAVTLEALRTFAALSLLIRARGDRLAVPGLLPAASVVDLASANTRSFTVGVPVANELDAIDNRALANPPTEGILARSEISIFVQPATSIVFQALICLYVLSQTDIGFGRLLKSRAYRS